MHTVYGGLSGLTELQEKIMGVIIIWVHKEKTPIPLKLIMTKMKEQNVKAPTAINSINGLLKKGYIRRACIISNKTYYVLLRTL